MSTNNECIRITNRSYDFCKIRKIELNSTCIRLFLENRYKYVNMYIIRKDSITAIFIITKKAKTIAKIYIY